MSCIQLTLIDLLTKKSHKRRKQDERMKKMAKNQRPDGSQKGSFDEKTQRGMIHMSLTCVDLKN